MMKKISLYLSISLLLMLSFGCTQEDLNDKEKLTSFIQTWGFLKYYHPVPSNGELDWDSVFVEKLNTIDTLKSKSDVNQFYTDWISSLGEVPSCDSCSIVPEDTLIVNLDFDWLDNSKIFNEEVKNQLKYIRKNRSTIGDYYTSSFDEEGFIHFKKEKEYDEAYPSKEIRLLALARLWNVINYYFPYKNIADEDWDKILPEQIEAFAQAKNAEEYHISVVRLTAKLDDTHAYSFSNTIKNLRGKYHVPFDLTVVDDMVVVVPNGDDSLTRVIGIQNGDVISKIDGRTVKQWKDSLSSTMACSNEATLSRDMRWNLFNLDKDSIKVVVDRQGKEFEKYIKLYENDEIHWDYHPNETVYKSYPNDIAYISLGLIQNEEVNWIFDSLQTKKGLIVDDRGHADGTGTYKLLGLIKNEPTKFSFIMYPQNKFPGTFYKGEFGEFVVDSASSYNGKVALLCNSYTQSAGEYTLMAYQTIPGSKVIGSQTAGADGNVAGLKLSGGIETYYSGLGVFYPNGKPTQRIGIQPDIKVEPSLEDVRNQRDAVLERALKYLNEGD